MPFLKSLSFWKPRHQKLPEEWGSSIKQPVNDGMNFYVKYLGSTLVDKASDETTTAEAIKSIIVMAKMSGKKLKRVTLTIKPSGLKATDVSNGNVDIDVSIYRISYCSADATFDRVVAFIATNKNETFECHAFLTSKRKIAQAAALTISQAFNIAFEKWQEKSESKSKPDFNSNNGIVSSSEAALIDLSFDHQKVNEKSETSSTPEMKVIHPPNGATTSKGSSSKPINNFRERFDEDDLDESFFMLAKSRAESQGPSGFGLLPNNVTKSDFDPDDLSEYLSSQNTKGKDDIFFTSDSPDDLFNL